MTNLPFNYSIRRNARIQKVRLVVTLNKVEIVAPYLITETQIKQFVHSKQVWVVNALNKLATENANHQHNPIHFSDGAEITIQNTTYPLKVQSSARKRVKIMFTDTLVAHVPEQLPPVAQHDAIKAAIIKWLKTYTKNTVVTLVNQHSVPYQLIPRTIVIKTLKSRWGSCGIHNDIHINWLLIIAPPEVLEYVVVHELCHIRIRNHSAHFWALVALHLPHYQKQRQWLKQHGSQLMSNWL